jgi:hypothetical protein
MADRSDPARGSRRLTAALAHLRSDCGHDRARYRHVGLLTCHGLDRNHPPLQIQGRQISHSTPEPGPP